MVLEFFLGYEIFVGISLFKFCSLLRIVTDSTCLTLTPWVNLRWKYSVFSNIQMRLNSINRVFQVLNILHDILVDLTLALHEDTWCILLGLLMWWHIINMRGRSLALIGKWIILPTKVGVISPIRISQNKAN